MKTITIGLTGDVMIGRLVNEVLKEEPARYPWGNLLPLLRKTDLNLINLETALTKCREKVPKVFNFRSAPKNVQVLQEARIDAVTLANNHVLDYTEQGLLETLDTLDAAKIARVGAGRTKREATTPLILEKKGFRIGILAYTDNEPGWEASENTPGTSYLRVGDIHCVQAAVSKIRESVDFLLVTYHWGPNMRERPTAEFVEFAHAIIDAGVDLLHGHSAHIFQGIEAYHGKCILYDTGDFVDDYAVDPVLRNDQSFLFLVEVSTTGIQAVHLVPTVISNFQVNRASNSEAAEIMQRMRDLSLQLNPDHTFSLSDIYGVQALSLAWGSDQGHSR